VRILTLLFFSFILSSFFSQSKIIGKVIDEEFNETMPFANVLVKGTNNGVTTDFDGNYSVNVQAGTYTLIFSFVGYKTKELTDIIVKENDVKEINVNLSSASVGLEEVVVSVSVQKNTDEALLMMQKKSANLMDGLSSEAFKKVGSSNLANAIKRAPGVSIMGGKYVYVRGLGDRYTKSILNGIDIPGLDPDRNTIQMDLFPTNILDNVQIIKSFTADLPADFTGGLVNIVTKEFPSKKSPALSISLGYNPDMHFKSDYRSYKGSSTDILGFDNGQRKIPIDNNLSSFYNQSLNDLYSDNLNADFPNLNSQDYNTINILSNSFNPIMAAEKSNSLMNMSLGYSTGNQFDIGKKEHTIGWLGAISYNNQTEYFSEAIDNYFNTNTNPDVYALDTFRTQRGEIGINNVILSGLGGLSYRTDKSKFKLTLMHIQNGEKKAGRFRQENRFTDFVDYNKDNLEYSQRSITNIILSGTHTIIDSSFLSKLVDKIEWKISPTISKIHDKDVRSTIFIDDNNAFKYKDNTQPTRIWRFLNENHFNSKIDFTKNYELDSEKAKFKYGALATYQTRDFQIARFQVSCWDDPSVWSVINGDPNLIFDSNVLVTEPNPIGSYMNPRATITDRSSQFESSKRNFSGYISNELKLFGVLKTIVGLRMEKFDLFYTGQNSSGDNFNNENVINKLDLFPTGNFIFQMSENSNLRTSLTRTTARPSFKEASIAQIFDPLSNMTFVGNIDLKPSYIQNYDIRYEYFGKFSQMMAISFFYKTFQDPIEMTYYESAPTNFTPANLGSATVGGIEFEIRKNLEFISEVLKDLSFNINMSFIESRLTFSESEKSRRESSKRTGETVGDYRTLQGQAPYLINSGISYTNPDKGIQTGIFYNVQGKTLEIVGDGFRPDVYRIPFHSLNFNFSKTFGKERKSTVNLRANNLLGDVKESMVESYGTEALNFRLRNPGRIFSLGFKYRF
tara:strand:- start:2120 stop:5005 length:2886 start_codon:yes stop_codon:yes gene_type:complete